MKYVSKLYRVAFARPSLYRFNAKLFHLALHGLGILNYQDDLVSGERYLLREWLPHAVSGPKLLFCDVGANVGHYSRVLSEQFPQAVIHAFEPHPSTYSILKSSGLPADRVTCHNVALGQSRGSLALYDHSMRDGSEHASLYESTITEFHQQTSVATMVNVETLDEFAAREGIEYIDFLKIDTEGHELAVLAGASQLLRNRRIGHIQFEFNALNVYSRTFFRDFRNMLVDYDLYRLLPRGLLCLDTNVTITEIFGFQNILAVRKHARSAPVTLGS